MRIVDAFLAEMDQEAGATRRLLERLPEDKLSWKPHPKSMSLGKLAMHTAQINGFIAAMAAKDTFEMPPPPQPDPTTKAEILAAFEKSLTDAKGLLNQVDDARALANWSMIMGGKTMMTMPRAALYRIIMCSHQYHHRGQLTVYLRMLDVPLPSVYGPSADENPWAQA
jgi:uncharacterized damage-inducible protein DinB